MTSSVPTVKENPKFWHFWAWLVGLLLSFWVGVILTSLVLTLSGVMTVDPLDKVGDFFERNEGLGTLFVIVFSVLVSVLAYREATGTYASVGVFLGKTFLVGLGYVILPMLVVVLVDSLGGELPENPSMLLMGLWVLPAVVLGFFTTFIWPRKFFYQAVEKARNTAGSSS